MNTEFSSPLLEAAVTELSRLPGIGRKTALRLALHLLRQDTAASDALGNSIINMRHGIRYCSVCHNISPSEVCPICASEARDRRTVCVVENVRDVMLFENTGMYRGVYHVLGGVISPMDGIGAEQLSVKELLARLGSGEVKEVIMAMNPTVEGEATAMYLAKLIKPLGIKTTRLAYGLPVGGSLEYTDETTLYRALSGRDEL